MTETLVRPDRRPAATTLESTTASAQVPAAARLNEVNLTLGGRAILRNLSLTVERGEIVALVGTSGSGKSSTLRVLAGLAQPDGLAERQDSVGTVSVDGPPSVVFQDPRLLPWRSVSANIASGLYRLPLSRSEAQSRTRDILAEVGLSGRGEDWPAQLSGGQAQRVALARGLVGEPRLLLLDEPFSALDALTRTTMHSLLLSLWRRHQFGLLLVTHDVAEAVSLADRVLVLDDGHVVHSENIPTPRETLEATSAERHRARLLEHLGVIEESTNHEHL